MKSIISLYLLWYALIFHFDFLLDNEEAYDHSYMM